MVSSGGNFTVVIGQTGTQLLILLPAADATFDSWMANLPEEEKPAPGLRGPDDTPAGDGVPNLFKYALGLLPLTPSANAMPRLVYEGDYMAIEVTRAKGRGVAWTIESGDMLDTLSSIPYTVVIVEDFGETEKVRLVTGLTSSTDPIAFLRLRLDQI